MLLASVAVLLTELDTHALFFIICKLFVIIAYSTTLDLVCMYACIRGGPEFNDLLCFPF
jgi:hypothetical protein